MNIKEFTESAIAIYQEKGGTVNPTIGKTIREHFDLRNDKTILVNGQCKLIKNYMRFHKKA